MKTLKICLVILCLLHVRAVGMPQFSGANFFMIKYIKTNYHGIKRIYIDDNDSHYLENKKIHIIKNTKSENYYVMVRPIGGRTNCRLHRLITAAPHGMDVDHINGNGLDNRRANLRICTRSQNLCNMIRSRKNTSGYKGVQYNNGSWMARLRHNGKGLYIGTYKDINTAIEEYNKKVIELRGEFAVRSEIYLSQRRKYIRKNGI